MYKKSYIYALHKPALLLFFKSILILLSFNLHVPQIRLNKHVHHPTSSSFPLIEKKTKNIFSIPCFKPPQING